MFAFVFDIRGRPPITFCSTRNQWGNSFFICLHKDWTTPTWKSETKILWETSKNNLWTLTFDLQAFSDDLSIASSWRSRISVSLWDVDHFSSQSNPAPPTLRQSALLPTSQPALFIRMNLSCCLKQHWPTDSSFPSSCWWSWLVSTPGTSHRRLGPYRHCSLTVWPTASLLLCLLCLCLSAAVSFILYLISWVSPFSQLLCLTSICYGKSPRSDAGSVAHAVMNPFFFLNVNNDGTSSFDFLFFLSLYCCNVNLSQTTVQDKKQSNK